MAGFSWLASHGWLLMAKVDMALFGSRWRRQKSCHFLRKGGIIPCKNVGNPCFLWKGQGAYVLNL